MEAHIRAVTEVIVEDVARADVDEVVEGEVIVGLELRTTQGKILRLPLACRKFCDWGYKCFRVSITAQYGLACEAAIAAPVPAQVRSKGTSPISGSPFPDQHLSDSSETGMIAIIHELSCTAQRREWSAMRPT